MTLLPPALRWLLSDERALKKVRFLGLLFVRLFRVYSPRCFTACLMSRPRGSHDRARAVSELCDGGAYDPTLKDNIDSFL